MPQWQWAIAPADLDPVTGSEQAGRRPVLIVSKEDTNQVLDIITVLPLTSTVRKVYPSEVLLLAGTAGLTKDSIVMAHQIRTIAKQRVGRIYGYLADSQLRNAVQEAIMDHLDLFLEE